MTNYPGISVPFAAGLTNAAPVDAAQVGPAQQIFHDPMGRRWLILGRLLALGITVLLVLLALLAHALVAAPDSAKASDQAQLAAWPVIRRVPLHDSRSVDTDRLERERAPGELMAVVVSGSDALKYPARLQELVGQGHAVFAAPFSGRPLNGMTPLQLDIELAATQLALAGIIGSEARWVRCEGDGGALQSEARLAGRALPCAALPTQASSDSAAHSPVASIASLRPASTYRKALGMAMRGLLALIDAGLRGALVLTLVLLGVFLLRFFWVAWLMLARARRQARTRVADAAEDGDLPSVTVVVPAYNEEAVIVATVHSLLACSYPSPVQIVVVDDGSTDGTYAVAAHAFGSHPQVSVLTKRNGGKCTALNLGFARACTDIVVCIDADTQLDPEALRLLCRHFQDPRVGAVAGQPKVGNRRNFLTRVQALEYVVLNSVERQAMEGCNAITCIAGALGAYRKALIARLGGYASDTLAEDTDMTLRILRSGARVVYEDQAIAWTESPETLRDFMKQRFRWMFGTAQVAFKNRASLLAMKQGSFGMVAMPNLLLLQVGAGCLLLPIVDTVPAAAVLWLFVGDWMGWLFPHLRELLVALDHQLLWYGLFGLMTLAAIGMSAVALHLDRFERLRSLIWLLPMQLCLRVLLGVTAYRCIGRMLTGKPLAWGRLQRTGHIALPVGKVQRASVKSSHNWASRLARRAVLMLAILGSGVLAFAPAPAQAMPTGGAVLAPRAGTNPFQRVIMSEEVKGRQAAAPAAVDTAVHGVDRLRSVDPRLSLWGRGTAQSPSHRLIHAAIDAHIAQRPHAVAVEHEGRASTHAQLDAEANRVAAHLAAMGVGRSTAVGLFMQRGVPLVIGILAVLRRGAAYVPQDVSIVPLPMLQQVSDSARLNVVLTTAAREPDLAGLEGCTILAADALPPAVAMPAEPGEPDDRCFILFTTGTTGTPNDVEVTHRNVCTLLLTQPLAHCGTLVVRGSDIAACAATVNVLVAAPSILARLRPEQCPRIECVAPAAELAEALA